MDDITPELLEKIKRDFQTSFDESKKISALYERIRDGTATYKEVNEFAVATGESLASAFQNNLSSAVLPDGRMYYNIANRIIPETLNQNYNLISEVAVKVQETLNKRAGIGIKAIQPGLNKDRITGMINKISEADHYDDVAWVLNEPVINFSQSVVDDYIRENVEFQGAAGMRPKIIRATQGKCCEWCQKLSGIYSYPNVPSDVYRRHERCRCTVDYDPGSGKRKQNVHTKEWKSTEEHDKIKSRRNVEIKRDKAESPEAIESRVKQENGLGLVDQIAAHPKMLRAYTPDGLKKALEVNGYSVNPMNNGTYKGIPFEEGGGYKVNFHDGGLIMYHPEKRSHHKGAYYKISTGKGGQHRYDTEGNEIKDD